MSADGDRLLTRTRAWLRRHVPPGLRSLLGLVLMVGGLFGFLPVLGFWMLPLGAMLIALDVKPLLGWLRARRGKG